MKIRLALLVTAIAASLVPSLLPAQTVITQPLSDFGFCAGEAVTVAFTASGIVDPANRMTLQLSEASGSFDFGVTDLASSTTTSSGVIQAVLPESLISGSQYRLRVVASDPEVKSVDNGTDLSIDGKSYIHVGRARGGGRISDNIFIAVAGKPITFEYLEARGVTVSGYRWDLGAGALPEQSEAAAPTITYSVPGKQHITLTILTANGCELVEEMEVRVVPLNPVLSSEMLIAQGETTISADRPSSLWICPGSVCRVTTASDMTVYVESGGTLDASMFSGGVIYLKKEASLIGGGVSDAVVIYEDSESLRPEFLSQSATLQVPSLLFDYSKVPWGGCAASIPYTVYIRQGVKSVSAPQNENTFNAGFWVHNGGSLVNPGDKNTYYVEAGGHVTITGSGNTIYLQDGASMDARSGQDNRIFYEEKSTIMNPGAYGIMLPSSEITFVDETVSGVWEESAALGGRLVEISPNPAVDQVELRVDPSRGRVRGIELYDGVGRKVETFSTENGVPKLSLRGYSAGRYYVKVLTESGSYVRAVVKE